MSRFNFADSATLLCIWLLTACVCTAQIVPGSIEIELEIVLEWNPVQDPGAPNFEQTPTTLAALNDGTDRILVSTLGGTVRVMIQNGNNFELLAEPLLNSHQVGFQLQTETGMTAIALHPDFTNPGTFGFGKLYTLTSENGVSNGGLSSDDVDFPYDFEVHQDVLREWDISAVVGNAALNSLPSLTTLDSRELIRVDQPGPYHNMFDISFNTSASPGDVDYGQLYVSLGDGGQSGSNSSSYASQIREPQDLATIYGNILRINPNPNAHALFRTASNSMASNGGQPSYSISADNPFNGDDAVEDRMAPTLAEIFSFGCRSPFRISFDSVTGDMFYGDVGEISREEITRIGAGGNGGWGRFEGTLLLNSSVELNKAAPHTPPVLEYSSSQGRTVICGPVYQGLQIPALQGKIIFADFGSNLPAARLCYGIVDPADPDYGAEYEMQLNENGATFPIDTNGDTMPDDVGLLPDRIFSVEELDGELLLIVGQDPRGHAPSVPGAAIVRIKNPVVLGDVNLDGAVNLLDVDPFIGLLSSGTYQPEGDINQDGVVNLLDVALFIELIAG